MLDRIRQAAGPVWFAGRADAPADVIVEAFTLDFPDHPLALSLKGSA